MSSISTEKVLAKTPTVIRKRAENERANVRRVFNTVDGQRAYEWLMDQFYHNQHKESEEVKLSRHAGRRDVMVLLRGIVETEK